MKKNYLLFVIIVLGVFMQISLYSCVEQREDNVAAESEGSHSPITHPSSDDGQKPLSESVNPAFYLGSDFGNYFQVLYRQEKYDIMLQHTSQESVEKHGSEKILSYYEKMQFAHRIKLNNMNKTSDSTYTMNYVINQMATRKMWRLEVEIENDSIKVVLPENIKDFLKY